MLGVPLWSSFMVKVLKRDDSLFVFKGETIWDISVICMKLFRMGLHLNLERIPLQTPRFPLYFAPLHLFPPAGDVFGALEGAFVLRDSVGGE